MQVYYENGASVCFNMSLLYQLTGDEKWFAAARMADGVCQLSRGDGWGIFYRGVCGGAASGYDLLYPKLSEEERSHVREHLVAVPDVVYGMRTDWWAGLLLHHDHWLPAAGLCVGALARSMERPRPMSGWRFSPGICSGRWMRWARMDRGPGRVQWNYALAMLAIYFDVRKHVTGEDLFHQPWTGKSITYRLYQWLPPNRYIYHHDSFPNGRYNVLGAALFASACASWRRKSTAGCAVAGGA